MQTHVSKDLKRRAVQYYSNYRNNTATAKTFTVPQTSLKRCVDMYNEHGSVSRKQR